MNEQLSLWQFDGATYNEDRDGDRLGRQLIAVRDLMLDGKWRTLRTIGFTLRAPDASVSARLRDLRKERFGGYTVERRYVAKGVWEYRVSR